jgi:ABC-type dipeptide/oligopeptide/nickel transport system permease component
MLILLFAIKLDWLPVSERGGFQHVILPAMTLALSLSAILTQVTRASMIEVVREDFVNVARAKGSGPIRLWFKHALANAMMPIITIIGLQFGALLTGTVIVETIFDWPGVGTLLFQSIQQRNYPLVQGCVLFIAFTYVAVNLLTDLAYAAANPKVRLS